MMSNSLENTRSDFPVLSISELAQLLQSVVEETFGRIRVRGEISGLKTHTSGHHYLALKDADAVLDAVIWRGTRLSMLPQDGLEVICQGRLTTYAGRSKYQMIIESLEVAGEGALLKLFEDRKRKLHAEGLFALDRKKPLPFLPRVIGVVTSSTGAVIRDILHRLADRFPRHVLIWPVLVQGDGAAGQIAAAIRGFNDLLPQLDIPAPDVIIVARGGGSLEDLWAFNEEVVVRATAESRIPVISAVGHETDTTLLDFVADHRAPTPSAAAEMVVPVRHALISDVAEWNARLIGGLHNTMGRQRTLLDHLTQRVPTPARMLGERGQRLDDWFERLIQQGRRTLERHLQQVETYGQLLESASFKRVLERGFALIQKPGQGPITSVAQLPAGQEFILHLHDGQQRAVTVANQPRAAKTRRPSIDQLNWLDK